MMRSSGHYTRRRGRDPAEQLGVDKMTVSRWERGALRPSDESLAVIEQLRKQAVRRGVTIPA